MTAIETRFRIEWNSKISSLLSWKRFRNDKDFLETLEDLLFWQIMKESDRWDYVSKEDIFNVLDKNIWK